MKEVGWDSEGAHNERVMGLVIEDEALEKRIRDVARRTGLALDEVVLLAWHIVLQREGGAAAAAPSPAEQEVAEQVGEIERRMGASAAELLRDDPFVRGASRAG